MNSYYLLSGEETKASKDDYFFKLINLLLFYLIS